ncbi:MAG: hypothetical protein E6R13_09295 [Spirochaetes bacterium]|nr:MAG: hypothetical protein E6R13_09295 [Spirochaetota bacterium]
MPRKREDINIYLIDDVKTTRDNKDLHLLYLQNLNTYNTSLKKETILVKIDGDIGITLSRIDSDLIPDLMLSIINYYYEK